MRRHQRKRFSLDTRVRLSLVLTAAFLGALASSSHELTSTASAQEMTASPSSRGETATPTNTPTTLPAPTPPATATPTGGTSPTPEATATPGSVPDVVEATIDSTGGSITSADGRATLIFPEGASTERLRVSVKTRSPDTLPPNDEHVMIEVWDFEARAIDRSWAEVSSFEAPVTVNLKLSDEDMAGLMSHTLQLYSLDENTGAWEALETTPTAPREWAVSLDHFSTYGPAADEAVAMPPLTDEAVVDLNGGSANLSLPIELPPGRAGFAPTLNLTYSSATVNEMKSSYSVGSWVGIGFALDLPYISRQGSGYFLNMNGVSGEIVEIDGEYRMKRESHIKIRKECDNPVPDQDCWTVVTKDGSVYEFGATEDSYRFWEDFQFGAGWIEQPYRWDLSSARDVHGNSYTATYARVMSYPHWVFLYLGLSWAEIPQYVISSYPSTIVYNAGGTDEARVDFITGHDLQHYDSGTSPTIEQWLEVRSDAAIEHIESGGCVDVSAPVVFDTRFLDRIEIRASNGTSLQPVRSYDFSYAATPPCTTWQAGEYRLTGVTLLGRDGTSPLYSQAFDYETRRLAWETSMSPMEFNRPFLTSYKNGFGGEVRFTYQEKDGASALPFWTRQIVTEKRLMASWGGTSDVTTAYDYAAYPDYLDATDRWDADYKGYATVKETDAVGNFVIHNFHTVTDGSPDTYNPFEGFEYETSWFGVGTNFQQKSEITWSSITLHDDGQVSDDEVYFVYVGAEEVTLKDNSRTRTEYRVTDGSGTPDSCVETAITCEVTTVMSIGDAVLGGDERESRLYFNVVYDPGADPNRYLVKPRTNEQRGELAQLMAETSYFYDGSSSLGTLGDRGIVTAVRRLAECGLAQAPCEPAAAAEPSYVCAYQAYDAYGNVVKSSSSTTAPSPQNCPSSNSDPLGYIPAGVPRSETVFDSTWQKFPVLQKQPLVNVPLETSIQYDYVLGKPVSVQDPSGNVVNYQYDGFGRPLKVWDNLTTQAIPATQYEFDTDLANEPNWVKVSHPAAGGTQGLWQLACFDGFGRQVVTLSPDDEFESVASGGRRFNNRGQVDRETVPYLIPTASGCTAPDPAKPATTYQYDPLGRTKSVDTAGDVATFTYNGRTTTTIDPNGHQKQQIVDAYGQTKTVKEFTGSQAPYTEYASTNYQYDPLGRLELVTDAQGNQTQMQYDMLGRKTAMTDPDMGYWTYGYDAAGNLISQTDARFITTTLAYDALNRLTAKSYSNGDPGVFFYYDAQDTSECPEGLSGGTFGRGRLTQMWDSLSLDWAQYCYDERGRPTRDVRPVGNDYYYVTRTYDIGNRVQDLVYPDGEVLRYSYDPYHGGLASMCSWDTGAQGCAAGGQYLTNVTYTPAGVPDLVSLGNGLTTDYGYESAYPTRVNSIVTGAIQDLTLTFDDAGNVKTVSDAVAGETIAYEYDALDRLTGATGFADGTEARYEYDTIGNLTRKQEGPLDLTLEYPASGASSVRPHAATAAKFAEGGGTYRTLAYDPNGNLDYVSSTAASNYTFDAENRLKVRTFGASSTVYTYDGNGTMVQRDTMGASGTESTVYIGGIYERRDDGTATKYYAALGRMIAMREVPPAGGGGDLRYLLADHLGGTTVVTDEAGAVLAQRAYWPYGGERSVAGDQRLTDLWYTGQREEEYDALGLYNYKARFYSTTLGRFVSADPWVTSGDNGGLNRYAYVRNNPLRFTDPSGYDPTQQDIDSCAASLAACFAWTYGVSPNGLVIVMGIGQGINGGLPGGVGDYWGYAQEFLRRYNPGCAGRVAECWDAVQMLMKDSGPDAVYDVFGIMFIESDPGGNLWQGATGIGTDRGRGELEDIVFDPRNKELQGVIGVSLGAVTVADFYADNEKLRVPFFLDSPPQDIKSCLIGNLICYTWLDYNEKAEGHQAYTGKFGFWSGENCVSPVPHCVNNGRAREVFDLLADKARELGR